MLQYKKLINLKNKKIPFHTIKMESKMPDIEKYHARISSQMKLTNMHLKCSVVKNIPPLSTSGLNKTSLILAIN